MKNSMRTDDESEKEANRRIDWEIEMEKQEDTHRRKTWNYET